MIRRQFLYRTIFVIQLTRKLPEINMMNHCLNPLNISFKDVLLRDWRLSSSVLDNETCLFSVLTLQRLERNLAVRISSISSHFTGYQLDQIIIENIPFLVAINLNLKEILLLSPRLQKEKLLVRINQDDPEWKSFCEKIQDIQNNHQGVVDLDYLKEKYPNLKARYHTQENQSKEFQRVDQETKNNIELLLPKMREYKADLMEFFSNKALDATAKYAGLRIHLLQFLIILPSLEFDKKGVQVKESFLESLHYLFQKNNHSEKNELPFLYRILFKIIYFPSKFIPPKFLAKLIRISVKQIARRFIAGESIESSRQTLELISSSHRDYTLDQLGELILTSKEADNYKNNVISIVKGLKNQIVPGSKNKANINKAHVSIKVSALCPNFLSHAKEYTIEQIYPRLQEILLCGLSEQVFINIDAEYYEFRETIFEAYARVLVNTPELNTYQSTGIVLQAYVKDAYEHFQEILALAKKRQLIMPIRLVKGAYWDAETIEAEANGHKAPQFLNKIETDIHFRQLAEAILTESKDLQLCLASHNLADHSYVEALRKELYEFAPVIEHQCLHMTYEALSMGMAKMGWVVRNYVPIGSLLIGMAYLVRRIMENSSQIGVLTIMRSHLGDFQYQPPESEYLNIKNKLRTDPMLDISNAEFYNIAPARFYLNNELDDFEIKANYFSNQLLGDYYDNPSVKNDQLQEIYCSSKPNLLVGSISFANRNDVSRCVQKLKSAYLNNQWFEDKNLRIKTLLKLSDLLLFHRDKLSTLIMYEAGKSILEAQGDVDEAIDFINYYSHQEAKVDASFKSRGITAVIAPWNFPLAIPCGMVVSALLAGNPVVLKSAEQTPLVAQYFTNLLYESGVTQDLFVHLPGNGEIIGAALVEHEDIGMIVFTGSKAVGIQIIQEARKRIYDNPKYKRSYPVKVIAEMGGKNALIISSTADLDQAVSGVITSAFSHAGQKCSALSRVIIDHQIKDLFCARLVEAISEIKTGSALSKETTINPLVQQEDQERIKNEVPKILEEVAQFKGKVHLNLSDKNYEGYCVGPMIVEIPAKRSYDKNSYCQKELFAPILHIISYHGREEALDLFNSTSYALTGGLYSQSQKEIDYFSSYMQSGQVYINRNITGARVAIEPFGGFKYSGTGPKAGGRHYLPEFHINDYKPNKNVCSVDSESSRKLMKTIRPIKPQNKLTLKRRKLICNVLRQNTCFEFADWLEKNYSTDNEINHVIPGQISYDDRQLVKSYACYIVNNHTPAQPVIQSLCAALLLGTAVKILATNVESFIKWSVIYSQLQQNGIPRQQIKLKQIGMDRLLNEMKEIPAEIVIVDGNQKAYEEILPVLCEEVSKSEYFRKIIVSSELPECGDSVLNLFIHHRSFAVNIMHHGAPLA